MKLFAPIMLIIGLAFFTLIGAKILSVVFRVFGDDGKPKVTGAHWFFGFILGLIMIYLFKKYL